MSKKHVSKSPSPSGSSPKTNGGKVELYRDSNLKESLVNDLKSLLSDETTVDLEFVVGQHRVKAHRLIVVARCEKYKSKKRAWLQNSGEHRMTTVQLSKLCTTAGVEAVVKYLYTGQIDLHSVEPFQILHLCCELGLPALQTHTLNHIFTTLTPSTVCQVMLGANTLLVGNKDEGLKVIVERIVQECVSYIESHTRAVFQSKGFLELPKEVLVAIISNNKLSVPEEDVWRAVVQWGQHKSHVTENISVWSDDDRTKVQSALEGVIEQVRVMEINSEVFAKEVEPTGLLPMELTLARYRAAAVHGRGSGSDLSRPRSGVQEPFEDSDILEGRVDLQMLINEWCGCPSQQEWVLLFRATRDGFQARSFHSCCDEKGATVSVIKTPSGCVFGGYTDMNWSSRFKRGKFASSQNSFIFSLVNSFDLPPTKLPISQPAYAINNHPSNGPIFGSGADLCISNDCHRNKDSYSQLGHSYGDSNVQTNLLNGEQYFSVEEYEVFAMAT